MKARRRQGVARTPSGPQAFKKLLTEAATQVWCWGPRKTGGLSSASTSAGTAFPAPAGGSWSEASSFPSSSLCRSLVGLGGAQPGAPKEERGIQSRKPPNGRSGHSRSNHFLTSDFKSLLVERYGATAVAEEALRPHPGPRLEVMCFHPLQGVWKLDTSTLSQ